MSRNIVKSLQMPIENSFGMLEKFIEICPEQIWLEKNGGWPVWQQVYHNLTVISFFFGPDNAPASPLADRDVARLAKQGEQPISRQDMAKLAKAYKAKADQAIAALTDVDLSLPNPFLPDFMRGTDYAATLSMLNMHLGYHLGSCDAALRDHGLEGVF